MIFSISRLLGSKIEAEAKPDALAEQLSRINEQLAIKNRRAKRVWKVLAFIIGGIIVMYILGIIAFTGLTAHPFQSNTEEISQVIVGTETDNYLFQIEQFCGIVLIKHSDSSLDVVVVYSKDFVSVLILFA